MGAADLAIATVVLAAATWLLQRSLRRRGGPCPGCSSGGCRPPGKNGPSGVVRIGRMRRPAGR